MIPFYQFDNVIIRKGDKDMNDYNNSNYHKQEGNVTKTVEVLITNY